MKLRNIALATGILIGVTGILAKTSAQEPLQPSEQVVQIDSTGLKLRTALLNAKTPSATKKALIAYGEWILENKDPNEARQFMALVSYDKYHNKMEWEAGGYLAAMIGLGIVPIDTAVAVFDGIGCPADTALSFVKRKVGEEAQINAIFNYALYRKIDPLKAIGRMTGTKNPYGLSKAVELVGIGYGQVGEPEAVVDELSRYGNMISVMNALLGNENLWKNLPYMIGLLNATVEKSNQNEKPANMERLGRVVYERVKEGATKDLARWFVVSQFSNSSGAADQYASACFLLYGAGFYASADTVIGLAKNCGSNPDSVLRNYYSEYQKGRVAIDQYLSLVQRCGEFYYCTPEQAVEYMCKTGNKKALEKSIAFIEKYGAAVGTAEVLSKSLYSHFSVVDVFNSFIKSELGKRKDSYVTPFYSNAIFCAGMDEIDKVIEMVAREIDGDYDFAKTVVRELKNKDEARAGKLTATMVGNALKDFDKIWNAWVKNPSSENDVKLDGVLEFLIEGYGSNDEATKKLNDILLSDKYTEAQKQRVRKIIELRAKTDRQAAAAYELLKAKMSNENSSADNSKIIKAFLDDVKKQNITDFKGCRDYNSTSKTEIKKIIAKMAGSITTFEQDIQEILNGKKGNERKILIWTIVEAVCEGNSSAAVLKAMNLVKDPVFSRQEAEGILAHISIWDSSKNYNGLKVQINEMLKWIQENKKNGEKNK